MYWMLFFTMFFVVIGYYVPRLWLEYIDPREYFKMELPLAVDGTEHKPCDAVKFLSKRTAETDLYIHIHTDFSRSADMGLETVYSEDRTRTVPKGEGVVITSYSLPCDIPEGTYLIKGTVSYEVQGVKRYYYFISDTFEVRR